MEDFQKEFDAGGFVDGGEAFKAELVQAEQSLDRNGLPLVDFSLSSGTYDPQARIRPPDFDESVNMSQFLKAGSYPMGVLGNASRTEPPPRFGMSMVQSWQASGRLPEDAFGTTNSTLPGSRQTFSVSRGSGYSQIHGSGGSGVPGPVRVGTYTVLTATGSAPDTSCGRTDATDDTADQPPTAARPGQRRDAEAAAEEKARSSAAGGTAGVERTSRTMESSGASQEVTLTASADHGRPSQESGDGTVTLAGGGRPSQDSQDVTVTPEKSRPDRDAIVTPTGERTRPRHSAAALGDSLRRKIVDVLNRTEEARQQLLTSGRPTTRATVVTQRVTVSEMVALAEQPTVGGADDRQPAPASPTVCDEVNTNGSWVSGGATQMAGRQDRRDDLHQRQRHEMEAHMQRHKERTEAARDQQAALRQQWELEQDRKEKVARQKSLKKKRDSKAKSAGAASSGRSAEATGSAPEAEQAAASDLLAPRPADETPAAAAPVDEPEPQTNDDRPQPAPAPPAVDAPAADPNVVLRALQELEAVPAPVSMQQVVEAVMRQIAVPNTSLDESVRSRTELNVTDILHELRGEGEQLNSQLVRSARGGGGGGGRDVSRMAETVSRLHRGVPARPRGQQPTRRSPVQRSASIPVQRPAAGRAGAGATRRRPASTAPSDPSGDEGATRRRPNSAQAGLAVRGRRVPRMGVRRASKELTSQTDDSDHRGPAPAKRGSPARSVVSRKQPSGRAAVAAAETAKVKAVPVVSTCPETGSSEGSGGTYSITSDRAPGSLPAIALGPEPERAAPVGSENSGRASAEYESPEFLVAQAARRYPSSTPSLARSVAAAAAAGTLDDVSPIVPAELDAAVVAAAPAAEPASSLAVLVPPPARWASEESSVEVALPPPPPAATSTGSLATTSAQPSSIGAASLPGTTPASLPIVVAGSTSAEAAGAAPRPRRSRIPTPVRRHVSDLAAAASCQSAPSLLQQTERGAAVPAPLPALLPAAAVGRRPGAVLSGGDRPAGPRPVVRAYSADGAGTRDAAAQTSLVATDAAPAGQRQQRDRLACSVSAQAQMADVAGAKTRLGDGTPAIGVSTEVQTGTLAAAEPAPSAGAEAQGTRAAATGQRTTSVSTGAQTADLTFTKAPPLTTSVQPAPLVSAEAQTEADQWVERPPVAVTAEQNTRHQTPLATNTAHLRPAEAVAPADALSAPSPLSTELPAGRAGAQLTEFSGGPAPDCAGQTAEGHTTAGGQSALPEDASLAPPTGVTAGPAAGRQLVDTPEQVTHPDVLCTDIPADISVPVRNRTEHWVQLVPTVTSIHLNGAPLSPEEAPRAATVTLRSRTLLDRHQEAAVRVGVTPRVPGRLTVTLQLSVEPIERLAAGGGSAAAASRLELRLVAERPAVEVLSQEPGVLDFGTLPEDCRKVVPLTLVNLSRAAVPVTLSVLSAGRAFHLPDAEPSEAATRLTSTLAQFTLPAADTSRQGISPVTLNVALLTPCIDSDRDCPPLEPLQGQLQLQLDGAAPPAAEPLLVCRLCATVGRVKLRTRCREPLELRCLPAQTTSVNLPMKNTGNIPLELRLSVVGLRDSVWVRPDQVTVPACGERDVMLTFQPRDRASGGRGLLVLSVQPDGTAFEVDIRGVIGDCRTVDRPRPSSPEMKSARRHTSTIKRSSPTRSRSRSSSPRPVTAAGVVGSAPVVSARDTAVQTSLLALAPAGDGPDRDRHRHRRRTAEQPACRQPAQPTAPKSQWAPALSSNKQLLLWTGARCGRPAARSVTLRNSSDTDALALRVAIRNGPQFTFGGPDDEPAGPAALELSLPPLSDRELTVVYRPERVEAVTALLVFKPVVRPAAARGAGGVSSKFTIPLVAYSGSASLQLGVTAEQGLRLGEVQPGTTVHAPLTVTNAGDRQAFVVILAYRDAACRHPLAPSQFTARLSLAAGASHQVALVLRVPAGDQPPASLRVISGDDLLRHAFNQLPRDRPLSSRNASPGLMSVDFGGPFDGERDPEPAELAALAQLPAVADTFFGSLRQTRLPVRVTLSSRPMDSSDVFTNLHADDTVASILNYTTFANVTRDVRRPAAAATRGGPAPRATHAKPAAAQTQLSTSQRPARLPAPAADAARTVPVVSDVSVESGPAGSTPEQVTAGCPTLAPPADGPSGPAHPSHDMFPGPTCGGGGRAAPLQLASDQVVFPTTAVGQRSAATMGFTNGSGVTLRWSLEALVKPWMQSTPRGGDLAQVGGDVFRFHPTQGQVRPGQSVSLAARFQPPAAGYFTQTFYLVTRAENAPLECDQSVQPSCLLVRVAGQATQPPPPAAVAESDRFPLTIQPDTIEFSADQRAGKLTINNKTRLDYEFELHVVGPFSVNHQRMLSRARRYIHLPVFFRPPGAGLYSGRLTLSLTPPAGSGAARQFHVTLQGEVP